MIIAKIEGLEYYNLPIASQIKESLNHATKISPNIYLGLFLWQSRRG